MSNTACGLLKHILLALGVGVLFANLLHPTPAHAVAIPAGQSTANDLILNFDFTGKVPSPPYYTTDILTRSTHTTGATLTFDVFDSLNGVGLSSTTSGNLSDTFFFAGTSTFTPYVTDGLFSIGFRVTGGTAELISLAAVATAIDRVSQIRIDAVLPQDTKVPEPGSLALLGGGLAAIAGVRRRHMSLKTNVC
jgi:hypothetical protein